ncbi:ubiquinone biosynthesis O-methyltransferase, mitochondrial isoform X2 [Hyposmocoma kahamanoa]|uniref:ubiquinone biosynthesis O-methyltransferase, mitochondrial isoform X2 n=1 Tax=Hyposmocoma kahamanoa TaxID=1477025 RepID=UPI000E6DA47D|nr:ubiquinone biosynthesis O-methyltransferase, mitochondrial isoform X2 [Hyposmocoma kahamanoa]
MTAKIRSTQWLLRNILVNININLNNKIHTSQSLRCYALKESMSSKSTVDQSDVDLHTKETKEWWNVNGPMKALHSFNLIRVPFVRDGLIMNESSQRCSEPLKNKQILDVGCGGGILSEPLARLGAHVTGVDASNDLIEYARKHSQADAKLICNQPTYICTSIEDHATENENKYDGVVASEIVEHVNNKDVFVQSCIKVLKPGGRIFFTTPSKTKCAEFAVIFMAENIFKITPKGTHDIEKFITANDLTLLLERNNCHVEIIYGIFYNLLTNTWSWSNYTVFLYALQARKLKG